MLVQEQGEELRVISYASCNLSLRTDNGPHFTSEYFTKYLEENGIEHGRTVLLWPQANGEVERQNRSILKRLRITQAEGRNWKSEMDNFLMMYRRPPHSTAGVSLAELLFRRRIRTRPPHLQESDIEDEVRDRDSERKAKGKVYAECQRNARESEIREGDKVLLRQEKENKLSTPYRQSPFTECNPCEEVFERDYDVLPDTSKSTEAQRATQSLSNQESRKTVNVSSERASEDGPLEYT